MSINLENVYEIQAHTPKKASSSAKPCRICGEAIEYTRRTARDWNHIQYCSAVCRRIGVAQERRMAS